MSCLFLFNAWVFVSYTPWKINGWNLNITQLKWKIIFQTSMFGFPRLTHPKFNRKRVEKSQKRKGSSSNLIILSVLHFGKLRWQWTDDNVYDVCIYIYIPGPFQGCQMVAKDLSIQHPLGFKDGTLWKVLVYFLSHRIHGKNGIFTYMKTIKINHSWIGKYTGLVPWIRHGYWTWYFFQPPEFFPLNLKSTLRDP